MAAQEILIFDHELDPIQSTIAELERAGFKVRTAQTVAAARKALELRRPSLLIVEWTLPDSAGREFLREQSGIATIVTSAYPSGIDAVVALESGARDYVGKPLDPAVFLARARAVLRRASTPLPSSLPSPLANHAIFVVGELEVDIGARAVRCAGQNVELSRSEFDVLEALLSERGRVMSRRALIEAVIGENAGVTSRVVDTHVFTLRRKLGACGKHVQTVRGVGYRFG